MLRATNLVGFGGGGKFNALTQITDYTGTTNIGDMTGAGGLAAAFDGNANQTFSACAAEGSGGTRSAYVGKQWAGGASKTIGRFSVTDPNNEGHASSGVSTTLHLYGKNGAPSSPTDGTLLFSSPSQAYAGGSTSTYDTTAVNTINTSNAYTHHWITIEPAGATGTLYIAEVIFYEWV
jgi:hypothetical protein